MKKSSYTVAIATILALAPAMAAARQSATGGEPQGDSVAAAARAVRAQKQNKPAPKVWDNDNLPKQGGVSVVGQEAPPSAAAATPAGQASAGAPAQSGSQQEQPSTLANLDAAKKQLESVKAEIDVQQRKYALDQQSYYGETNFEADKQGAAALRDEKEQIDAKQQEVDALQKKIDEMAAKLSPGSEQSQSESK